MRQIVSLESWWPFIVCNGALLLLTLVMSAQSRNLFTFLRGKIRLFSIMELEIPSGPDGIAALIKGIYSLNINQKRVSLINLRGQLLVDFLFMPAAYGAIFFLCMKLSLKMHTTGHTFFWWLAMLQVLPWLLDIIENFFLLSQIKATVTRLQPGTYKAYVIMEIVKWGSAIGAAVCALSSVIYFWLSGAYGSDALVAASYVLIELILFGAGLYLIKKFSKKRVGSESS